MDPLDNPTWYALTNRHAAFAEVDGLARRYRPDVSVFAAIDEPSPEAWTALAALAGPGTDLVMNRLGVVEPPPDWTVHRNGRGFQMVLDGEPDDDTAVDLRALTNDDVDEMMALVQLTEPGPFRRRTIELGGYLGFFEDGRLLAMAGQRVGLDEHTEISAVCTHPDARRRGLAGSVSAAVARNIRAEGRTPILHVAENNVEAKRVYERLGFGVRTMLTFAAMRTPGRP